MEKHTVSYTEVSHVRGLLLGLFVGCLTGIFPAGCLLTEGCRGEGGILRNSEGDPPSWRGTRMILRVNTDLHASLVTLDALFPHFRKVAAAFESEDLLLMQSPCGCYKQN